MKTTTALFAAASTLALATPALAAPGDPIALGEDISFDLQATVRVRYEGVDQANIPASADALTVRGRLGGELTFWGIKLLAEGEATGALVNEYNDTLPQNGVEPFPTVADAESIELNRLQLSYVENGNGVTVGRQRINYGNQRWVGSVGWRQNEQTFDAVRAQFKSGPFSVDGAVAISQRTIFGADSPNSHFDGDLVMANATLDLPQVDITAFTVLLDYDTRLAFSSNTFGVIASASLPVAPGITLSGSATFATQSDAGANPVDYRTEYLQAEIGTTLAGFTLSLAYEELGSDGGVAAFQTPLATLHAFQGWADLFLTTPARGVRDLYGTVRRQFTLPVLGQMTGQVTYHQFDSDVGGIDYGHEWNASLGFRIGPVNLLAKYANYQANAFGTDTEKFWLQAEYGF